MLFFDMGKKKAKKVDFSPFLRSKGVSRKGVKTNMAWRFEKVKV